MLMEYLVYKLIYFGFYCVLLKRDARCEAETLWRPARVSAARFCRGLTVAGRSRRSGIAALGGVTIG